MKETKEVKDIAEVKASAIAKDDSSVAIRLVQEALNKGTDVATIEKLIDVGEKIAKKQAREAFFRALSQMQSEMPPVPHTKRVYNRDGTLRYTYAAFEDIIRVISPYLGKYGFSIHFKTEFENGHVVVHCILTHAAGHSETTSFRAPVHFSFPSNAEGKEKRMMSPIQEYGAALTFAKRYALSLALGLATEEDTDAQIEDVEINKVETAGHKDLLTEKQLKAIHSILIQRGLDKDGRLEIISQIIGRKASSLDELTKEEASKVISTLQKQDKTLGEQDEDPF